MLTIIICSINTKLKDDLITNINNSIGEIVHEIIVHHNHEENESIAKVYNRLKDQAKFRFLLFIHEDVIIHSKNWGKILIDYFVNDPSLALVGVAGSKLKTRTPSAWWESEPSNWVINIIQRSKDQPKQNIKRGFDKDPLSEVVVIDGVFMALRKIKDLRFNENLTGFHNYDQSISMEVRKLGYKIYVTSNIAIEHFSGGNKNREWLRSNFLFYKLYKNSLPQKLYNDKIPATTLSYSYYRIIINLINFKRYGSAIYYWLFFIKLTPWSRGNRTIARHFLKLLKNI